MLILKILQKKNQDDDESIVDVDEDRVINDPNHGQTEPEQIENQSAHDQGNQNDSIVYQ